MDLAVKSWKANPLLTQPTTFIRHWRWLQDWNSRQVACSPSGYHYDGDNGGPRATRSPNWMKPDHSIDDDLINPSPIFCYQMILCEKFFEFAEGHSSNGNSRSSGFQRNMNDFPRWRNLLWWMVERMMRHSSFYYNKFGMFRGKRQHTLSAVGCFRFGHCLDKHQTHKSWIFPYFNFHAFEWIQHCSLSTE